MKKKFIALVAAVIICCYCITSASASVFKDKILNMDEFQSFDFQLQTSFGKLPQFSEDRMKQLNLFLQHLSFQGTVDSSRAQISVLLDNQLLFSYSESESAQHKQAIVSFKPDEFYILPSTVTEPTSSLDKLQNDFDSFIRDIKKIDALDLLLSAIKKISSEFPENIRITRIQPQSFRYYGRAVKKQTLSVSDEDMNAFMMNHFSILADLTGEALLSPPVFEGRQNISVLLTEDDLPVMITYSGRVGMGPDDIRSVRLDWKSSRKDNSERDELQLRTPNSQGTRRNNLLISYSWNIDESGIETAQWTIETDKLENRLRTRTFSEAFLELNNESIKGSLTGREVTPENTASTEAVFEISTGDDTQSAGTLEINHKYDKIEKERVFMTFRIMPESAEQVSSSKAAFINVDEESYPAFLSKMYAIIIRRLFQLPEEDLVFFREGIPADLWDLIQKEND